METSMTDKQLLDKLNRMIANCFELDHKDCIECRHHRSCKEYNEKVTLEEKINEQKRNL